MINSIKNNAKKKKKMKKSFVTFLLRLKIDQQRRMIFPLHEHDLAFTKKSNFRRKVTLRSRKVRNNRKSRPNGLFRKNRTSECYQY